jgi:hypothetical protein
MSKPERLAVGDLLVAIFDTEEVGHFPNEQSEKAVRMEETGPLSH